MIEQAKRDQAVLEAEEMRTQFFHGIGKMYEDVFAPLINPGLGGGYDWPANAPKFRAIHTAASTIIITDGLSDPFRNPARDFGMTYNGFSMEMYIELEGQIEFGDLIGHFSLDMLSQVCQAALGHGQLADLLNQFQYLSLSLFGAHPFPEKYHSMNSTYGVLLGTPSPNMPSTMPLNLEEVSLFSVRLIDKEQLILATTKDFGGDYRRDMVRSFQEDGSHAYTPHAF